MFGNDFESALHNLELVLDRVAEYGLQLKSTKCNLFRTSVPFLGHIVGRADLECDPNKLSAVANWIPPTTTKGVREFLGFTGYYRRFVPDYSMIAQDLYSYSPCGLPTGDLMPAEQAQIRLMTASPLTLRLLIPAPDQVTPEQAYYRDLNFYKKTLFHTPFLSRGRAITRASARACRYYSRWTHGLTPYHRWSRDTYCPYKASTRSGSTKPCATCNRTMHGANGVNRRPQTYNVTSCNTTRAGGQSGFALAE